MKLDEDFHCDVFYLLSGGSAILLYASSQEDSYSLPLERGIFLASLDMRIFST